MGKLFKYLNLHSIMKKSDKLNIGCGTDIKEGFVNLDKDKFPGVDVIQDLDKFPYDLKDNTFSEVHCHQVLEHVDDVFKTMNEIWRVCKNGAVVYIDVPHFSGLNAVTDPSHKHFFSSRSFNFFEKGKLGNYFDKISKVNFKVAERRIEYSNNKLLKIFNPLVNLNQTFYERFFAYIFPSQVLYFKLIVKK